MLTRHTFVSLLVHAVLIVCSAVAAFWLRFDGVLPDPATTLAFTLPLLLAVRSLVFLPFRIFQGLWRYTSLWDVRNIVVATAASSASAYLLLVLLDRRAVYPLSVLIIDAVLLIGALSGVRMARRLYADVHQTRRTRTVIVFGAGDAGEMIVRDMRNRPEYDAMPIGFLDDDPRKVGRSIHGIPVLGTGADAARIIAEHQPDEVLIAVPSAAPPVMRRIVRSLEHSKVRITTFPNLLHVLGKPVDVKQIRELRVEDLLSRAPVGLDWAPVRRVIAGQRVLVTGAGGSIGSEICRQVATLGPTHLIALDRYENTLVTLVDSLAPAVPGVTVSAVIADVTDRQRLDDVFAEHRPTIVFHAAAHKHVPLMEHNACEAIKNNVRGSRLVAEAARQAHASQFVLISTDKAVNAISVMGATKRVAELLMRAMGGAETATSFVTVRFGNVLGSNGSVVPRFLEQIRNGGPVTVTHPDVRRYFMLIPEAVQLVLCAATLPRRSGSYVLDMGEPVRLIDMAHDLIRLSGYIPEEEIAIDIVGLRPGEKLDEELWAAEETVEPSPVEKILSVSPAAAPHLPTAMLMRAILDLEDAAMESDTECAIARLRTLVPTLAADCSQPALMPKTETGS